MEAAALPAARMSKRPAGAAGRCGRKQPSGCAATTAVRNSDSRKARGDAIKIRPRARRDAQPEVRGAVGLWSCLQNSRTRRGLSINLSGHRQEPALESVPLRHYCYGIGIQRKDAAMALDDKTRTELEAAAFRRLVEHLRTRTDVQMSKDESRERIYGMPYEEWKAKYQKEASQTQRAAFEKAGHKH